jgi:signal peptidase II
MLYFPLFDFTFPSWVPFVGDQYFLFFSPVFNIADSSIFIGVVMILALQKTFFKEKESTGSTSVSVHKETHTVISEHGVTTTEEIIITGNPETTPDDKTDF